MGFPLCFLNLMPATLVQVCAYADPVEKTSCVRRKVLNPRPKAPRGPQAFRVRLEFSSMPCFRKERAPQVVSCCHRELQQCSLC